VGGIIEGIGSSEFLAGLRWGGIAAGMALLGALIWRRFRKERAPFVGLAGAGAILLAMPTVRPLNGTFLGGLGLLAMAGVIFPWTRRYPFLPVVAALPGAWLVATSGLPGPGWVPVMVFGVATICGPVISWFDEAAQVSQLPVLLFAISVAGVYVTVPDTEEALVMLGALAAPTLLAWPLRTARLGAVGGHVLVGVFLWVVAWGGRGREGSMVGAVAALGMLFAAPIGAWMARKQSVTTAGWPGFWLVALQVVVVAVTTRVAGLQTDPIDAASIAMPALAVALLLWVVTERSLGHAPRLDPTV
jgi:hypothetical protein